jgi:hypothetical protein
MERKKKLRIIQINFLVIGIIVIFFTYFNKQNNTDEEIFSKEKEIQSQLTDQLQNKDMFYNIEYSGIDLSGNRYILKSEEAYIDKSNQELVNMNYVKAVFYFKDDTILNVSSDLGVYNNKTLDMDFNKNVKALYEGSELFAQKATYLNSKSFLTISEKVKVIDERGTVFADKLIFDINKQTLNISSFNDNKIDANINLK